MIRAYLAAMIGVVSTVAAAASEPRTIDLACGLDAMVDTPIGRLCANGWNASAAGSYPAKQCLRRRETNGTVQYGWSWDWPPEGDVLLSFPQIVLGWRPWNGGTSSHAQLPARVRDIEAMRLSYSMETAATGKHSLATTLWITRSGRTGAKPDPRNIATDVVIWTDGQSFDPFGSKVGEASIDGTAFDVWFARDLGDGSDTGPRWNYVAYRTRRSLTTVSIDLKAVLRHAVAQGFVSADHFVSSVETGNEIMSGRGETWVRQFSLQIE